LNARQLAIFIDGWNFKYATYDAFGLRVDFGKLLAYLSRDSILLRAYYYMGDWDDGAINAYVNMSSAESRDEVRRGLLADRDNQRRFMRFLARNGYRVRSKPVRVFRTAEGQIQPKADMDLELAIDMLTLAERCDKHVLVSGDGDFAPLVDAVASRGVRVVVLSTQHYEAHRRANYRASDLLLDAADEFIPIEGIMDYIRRDQPEWRRESAPEAGNRREPVPVPPGEERKGEEPKGEEPKGEEP
jgi:uncharacterized LabA/DUF88 family protein